MPLEKEKCEIVLAGLKSMSVEKKLESIVEARKLYGQMFVPEMTVPEWTFSAMIVEQFYNLIREELRVNQIRIKENLPEEEAVKVEKKKTTPKKAKPQIPDIASLLAQFAAFNAEKEKK